MRAARTLALAVAFLAGLLHTSCGSASEHPSDVPVLVDLGPTWGSPNGGTRVTLYCIQADSVLTVFFNDQEATDVDFVRDSALNCTTPRGLPGLADVTVVGVGGTSTLPAAFLYLAPGTWVRADGGTDDDRANDTAYLPDGSNLLVGSFEGEAVFGAGETNETMLVSAGGRDAFVARYRADGALLTAKRIASGPFHDDALGVEALPDGSWLVVGAFTGPVVFGPGDPNETTLLGAGREDAYLARYRADGRLDWVRTFGSTGDDRLVDVARVAADAYAVAGAFEETVVLGAGEPGETLLASAGLGDALVALYDGAGSLRWVRRGGGPGDDAYAALAAWPGGDLLAVGTFQDDAVFGTTWLTSSGGRDGVLARYRSDGRVAWAEGVHGAGDVVPRAAAVFDNDDLAVTGSFAGDAVFGAGSADEVTLDANGGDRDLFVARYAPNGTPAWARRAGGTASGDTAEGVDVKTYADGTALVLGAFRGRAVFGPGELGETVLTSAGQGDLAFARLERGGALRWVFRDGGSGDEVPAGTDFVVDGTLLVCGAFSGTAALDPSGGGAITLPSAGERDPFLGRYDVDE